MKKRICKNHLLKISSKNKLEDFVKHQIAFCKKFHDIPLSDEYNKEKWTLEYLRCMSQEIAELIDMFHWKFWKNYKTHRWDIEEIKFEIADLLCFLIDISIVWDMDADEIYQYAMSKMKLNDKRQIDKRFDYI